MIVEYKYPDTMAILPSETYVFGLTGNSPTLDFSIVSRRTLVNKVDVLAINVGLLAFDFKQSIYGGFCRKDFRASGQIPQVVMDNTEALISLQVNRLRMAIFVAACVYGVHAKRGHTCVDSPLFPCLSDVFDWAELPNRGFLLPQADCNRLMRHLGARETALKTGEISSFSITPEEVNEGFELADRLLSAASDYVSADPVAMIVMAYQAMVLHGRQHAGASVALAAVVIEAAVEELLFANGCVSGFPGRLRKTALGASISRNNMKQLGFRAMTQKLCDEGIIDAYLKQRIDSLRDSRNDLMHRSQDAVPRQSGEALTALRDVLWLITGERGFELNVPWSYRL